MLRKLKVAVFSSSSGLPPFSYMALIVLLAYSGPFGTHMLGTFFYRLLFWGGIVCGAVLIGRLGQSVVEWRFAHRSPFMQDCLIVVMMMIWLTPFLWGFVWLLGHETLMLSLTGTLQYVVVVTAGLCVVRRSIPGLGLPWYFPGRPDGGEPAQPASVLPRLARRLPSGFVHPVLRLTVDDHMVEVIGQSETCRIRMRFADAVQEMEPVEGFCTHRSHWIMRDAVVGVERANGQLRVRLTNGDLVPVSRKYRGNLDVLEQPEPA